MLSRNSGCRRPRQPACKVPLRRRLQKTACSFMGVLCMAAAMDWLKS
jgi:hypothetical protein